MRFAVITDLEYGNLIRQVDRNLNMFVHEISVSDVSCVFAIGCLTAKLNRSCHCQEKKKMGGHGGQNNGCHCHSLRPVDSYEKNALAVFVEQFMIPIECTGKKVFMALGYQDQSYLDDDHSSLKLFVHNHFGGRYYHRMIQNVLYVVFEHHPDAESRYWLSRLLKKYNQFEMDPISSTTIDNDFLPISNIDMYRTICLKKRCESHSCNDLSHVPSQWSSESTEWNIVDSLNIDKYFPTIPKIEKPTIPIIIFFHFNLKQSDLDWPMHEQTAFYQTIRYSNVLGIFNGNMTSHQHIPTFGGETELRSQTEVGVPDPMMWNQIPIYHCPREQYMICDVSYGNLHVSYQTISTK